MLVKTLPVYMKWDRQTTVRDLLQTTRQQIQNNRAHDIFSFADLKALNPNISSQVLFAYQGDYDTSTAIGDLPFVQVPLMENATGELLAIELSRQKGKLVLRAEFHSNVYSPAYITRLISSYDQIVRAIVEADDDNTPVSSLTLMPDEDAQMVLKMGRGEEMRYDTSETFVSMFLRQAALTPDAIAIVDVVHSDFNRSPRVERDKIALKRSVRRIMLASCVSSIVWESKCMRRAAREPQRVEYLCHAVAAQIIIGIHIFKRLGSIYDVAATELECVDAKRRPNLTRDRIRAMVEARTLV
jgi:hypothetical protein